MKNLNRKSIKIKAGTILKKVARRVSIPVFKPFFARISPMDCIRAPKKEKSAPLKTILPNLFFISARQMPEITRIIPKKSRGEIFSLRNIKERSRVIRGEEVKISIESCGPSKRKLSKRSQSPRPSPMIPLKER